MILFKRLHGISLEYCVAGYAAGGAHAKTNSTISQCIDVPIIFIFMHIYAEKNLEASESSSTLGVLLGVKSSISGYHTCEMKCQ